MKPLMSEIQKEKHNIKLINTDLFNSNVYVKDVSEQIKHI